MAFFDAPPPPPPPVDPQPRRPEWWGPPEGWLGGFVPLRLVLARTPEVLITLGQIEAYPNGVHLQLQILTRGARLSSGGFLDPSETDWRLGVAFADGRKWQGVEPRPWKETPAGPILVPSGGGGSSNRWDQNLWLWPLPPDGPVTFALIWPEAGIDETTVQVEGALFRGAAGQAEQLWTPLTPEEEEAERKQARERRRGLAGVSRRMAFFAVGDADDDDAKKE